MLVKYNSYLQTKDYIKIKLNYFDNLSLFWELLIENKKTQTFSF